MDLLFSRYASPFVFLDTLISNGLFTQGIDEIWGCVSEDKAWEFYLHKVFNQSFDDFKKAEIDEPQEMTPDDFEATVNNSKSMLQGFDPRKSGG
jgi:hypothetical protein